MAYVFSFVVAAGTAAATLTALVATGETSGYENVVIVTLVTLVFAFATAFGMTRRARAAVIASALFTVIVVAGGFGLLYALFASLCGSDPSAC
jgi:hypothetical protein